jgi:hypothetical protein
LALKDCLCRDFDTPGALVIFGCFSSLWGWWWLSAGWLWPRAPAGVGTRAGSQADRGTAIPNVQRKPTHRISVRPSTYSANKPNGRGRGAQHERALNLRLPVGVYHFEGPQQLRTESHLPTSGLPSSSRSDTLASSCVGGGQVPRGSVKPQRGGERGLFLTRRRPWWSRAQRCRRP